MTAELIAALPAAGWAAVFLLIIVLGGFLGYICRLLMHKEVRLGKVELSSPKQKAVYKEEAHNLSETQRVNARNLLSKVWLDIYETGVRIFNITNRQEQFLLEDIAKLIDNSLQNAVHLDLLKNHLPSKSEADLLRYADVKAKGYLRMIKEFLLRYNEQLPNYNLREILNHIPRDEFKGIFEEIYMSACNMKKGGKDD